MRILVISPFLVGLESGNGGGVLTYRQISILSESNSISFLSFSGILGDDIEDKCIRSLAEVCKGGVQTIPLEISKFDVTRAILRSFCLVEPHLASICRLPRMQTAISEHLGMLNTDLVWIQFPQMAQYVAQCKSVPRIMDVQDAYTISGFRQAQRLQGLGQFRSFLDWVCWARYEARYYSQFAAVLTLSEQDAVVLQAMNPNNQVSCMGLPLAEGIVTTSSPVPMRVGFAGAFGHRPNIEGLRWFLRRVWPLVRAQIPAARFVVAGRNPPKEFVTQSDSGVEIVGFVPDIFEFYAANTVTVCPMVSGGGVKIKTVEAMLSGSAVVATRIGIEGVGATPGEDALVADDALAFANAVVQLLQDPTLRNRLSASGRSRAQRQFSAENWRTRINNMLSQLIGSSAAQ